MGPLLAKLRAAGKALLLGLLRLTFAPGAGAGALEPARLRSILVIRTDERVGNLLLTTPLLAALREALPQARVGLLCAARLAPLVPAGLSTELWPFEKRDLFRRPWRFVRFCVALRRARWDAVVEAGHWHAFSFTAGMMALWTGAPRRVGHRRWEADRLLTHAVEKDPTVDYDAAAKLELLRPLGLSCGSSPPLRTDLGLVEAARFRTLFGGPVLLLNPGGRKADHRWDPEGFARVAAELARAARLAVVVAWGPGEERIAEEVAAGSGGTLLPPTSLAELAGAIRASALFVTNDTGPMHLAVATGTPTVGIFLAADWRRWAAPGPAFAAVHVAGRGLDAAVGAVVEASMGLLSGARRDALTGRSADP